MDRSNQIGTDGSPSRTPHLREPLEAIHEDGRRESIFIKRLSNTDMLKWIDLGFDKSFLVFRSVELPSVGGASVPACASNQAWFDSLTQESAFALVEKALALNHSPVQKKVMAAAVANLQSWLSTTPSNSSMPAATTPAT